LYLLRNGSAYGIWWSQHQNMPQMHEQSHLGKQLAWRMKKTRHLEIPSYQYPSSTFMKNKREHLSPEPNLDKSDQNIDLHNTIR
jgi:hypothetical protein